MLNKEIKVEKNINNILKEIIICIFIFIINKVKNFEIFGGNLSKTNDENIYTDEELKFYEKRILDYHEISCEEEFRLISIFNNKNLPEIENKSKNIKCEYNEMNKFFLYSSLDLEKINNLNVCIKTIKKSKEIYLKHPPFLFYTDKKRKEKIIRVFAISCKDENPKLCCVTLKKSGKMEFELFEEDELLAIKNWYDYQQKILDLDISHDNKKYFTKIDGYNELANVLDYK